MADREATTAEISLIVDLRYALGDCGLRMQADLVEYARRIKGERDAALKCLEQIASGKRKTREQRLAHSCVTLLEQLSMEGVK